MLRTPYELVELSNEITDRKDIGIITLADLISLISAQHTMTVSFSLRTVRSLIRPGTTSQALSASLRMRALRLMRSRRSTRKLPSCAIDTYTCKWHCIRFSRTSTQHATLSDALSFDASGARSG